MEDEYFLEFTRVFKKILSKTSYIILKTCPFICDILEKGIDRLQEEIKKEMKVDTIRP